TTKRLSRLGENARRLASGAPVLSVQGHDEIAELDVIYRDMAATIKSSAQAHEAALAELREERDTIALLQRSLLPELPQIPGLQIASSYATPGASAQIGGDWFDVFVLPDGRVGLSVGDVAGHGFAAATVMGFVRQAIRIVSWRDPNPAAVMRYVNDLLCHGDNAMLVTAFFALFDPRSRLLTYTTAGHPHPMIASTDGDVFFLPGDGLLLGVEKDAALATRQHQMRGGDALILYTDGLFELERDYFKGMSDLESAVRAEILEASANPAEGVQRRIFAQIAPRDDAAILVMTIPVEEYVLRPDSSIFAREFDAHLPEEGRGAKRELIEALASLGRRAPDLVVAEIVFGELLANAVQHTPGLMQVSFSLEDENVVLMVRDRGQFLSSSNGISEMLPPAADLETGRGLFIVRSVSPRVAISVTGEWRVTTVVLPRAGPTFEPAIAPDT
ncbi:MAG: SpoIIE family protein phosphatase, partial [Vulcanimicrobiaceae bacterium]